MKIAERKETIMSFDCGSTVIVTDDFSKQDCRWLYVQCIDSYAFQRELVMTWDERAQQVQVHTYLHPHIREINYVPKKQAVEFVDGFVKLCREFPSLFFNKSGEIKARGFVQLHTKLLGGHKPNKNLL